MPSNLRLIDPDLPRWSASHGGGLPLDAVTQGVTSPPNVESGVARSTGSLSKYGDLLIPNFGIIAW